jgi:hypothetical protein
MDSSMEVDDGAIEGGGGSSMRPDLAHVCGAPKCGVKGRHKRCVGCLAVRYCSHDCQVMWREREREREGRREQAND